MQDFIESPGAPVADGGVESDGLGSPDVGYAHGYSDNIARLHLLRADIYTDSRELG
ncbi:hypothetical protein ES703_84990 [subsurface metagenome]